MLKKKTTLLLVLPLIVLLAACSSLKVPETSSGTDTSAQQGQPGQPFNMANQPIEQKLALGTLKLEGTNRAVTADQAKALLPLWKAVKTMSSDSSASPEELKALYQQIEEAMTSEQVQMIKDLNLAQEDLQALMKQYNIQFPQAPMMNGTPMPGRTPGARRTPGVQSGNRSGNGNNFGPGGDMGGGMPPDGGFPGGMPNGAQPNAQGTRPAGQPNRGFRGGMNNMFIDPLIKVLQDRASIPVQATPTSK